MKSMRRTLTATAVFLSVLGVFGFAVTRHPWRSDSELESLFRRHHKDFETLVLMGLQDVHLTRISPNFTWLDDSVAWPRKDLGISEQRWADYKQLFRKVGTDGIIKPTDPPPRIEFPIIANGIVPSGYSKGIVYSEKPLAPVLKSLDERPPDQYWDDKGHVRVYKQIENHWFIYFDQW